jgi:hypothetical protein
MPLMTLLLVGNTKLLELSYVSLGNKLFLHLVVGWPTTTHDDPAAGSIDLSNQA